ncbi:MAG: hypothetical protein ACYDB9_13135 [Gammaproteobacteria bacterium]
MNTAKLYIACVLLAAVLALGLCTGSSAATPAAVTDARLMRESFRQFDQNLKGGWRILQVQRDYPGATHAMLEYLSVHSATLKPWQKDSLAFHLGHVYALAGKRQEAIHWFQKSIADHRMDNPAYVESFIAFLENDKPALLADRHTIATTNPGPWRAKDLREMDAMLDYFGDPFEAAWSALMCHNPSAEGIGAAWFSYCKAIDGKYRRLYAKHGIK